MITDAQLHEPAIALEWAGSNEATRLDALTELQIGYLRAVGVDRAVLVPIDRAWGRHAVQHRPDMFAMVPMVTPAGAADGIDAGAPDIEDLIAEQAQDPSVVGIRVMRKMPSTFVEARGAPFSVLDRAIAACASERLPLFISTAGDLSAPVAIAERHPELTVIVDHLGIEQPPSYERQSPPFRALPELLRLAEHPNIALKLSGAPTLSEQTFPFADLWPNLRRLIDAFGPHRLMWGSDISRVMGRCGFHHRTRPDDGPYDGKHTYAESLYYLLLADELTTTEKEWLLGRTAQELLGWPA